MKLLSANHYWRIIAAGICYVVFAVGACIPGIYVFLLALMPLDAAAKQRRARNSIQALCRGYLCFMERLGLMEVKVSNPPSSSLQGHLVIANHTMLIDALIILALVPDLCCVVKSALCRNPFTRVPVRVAGYIANDDENLIDKATQKLALGENVLIFPEGTRNHYDTQLDFRRGAANIAILANTPILPAIICCQPRALQKGQSWYQLPKKKSLISVSFMTPLDPAQCIDTSLPRTLQYRRLTAWLKAYYLQEIQQIVADNPATV